MLRTMACFFLAYEMANLVFPKVLQGWKVRKTIKISEHGEMTVEENPNKTPFLWLYILIGIVYWVFLGMVAFNGGIKGILVAIGIILVGQTFGKLRPTTEAIRLDAAFCALLIGIWLVA